MDSEKLNLLVVEDELKLLQSLHKGLSREGFYVEDAANYADAEYKLQHKEFNLIVLDINLPDKPGFEIINNLRSHGDKIPVLILSARDKVEDRLRSFRLGADDYLMKPFDFGELVARIRALLNRAGGESSLLNAADLVMDLIKREVTRGSKHIILSQREFALLEYFLRNKNQIITSKRLAEQVWGYHFDTGTNIVNVYINYIRKAIDDGYEKKLLKTIRGQGFILEDE